MSLGEVDEIGGKELNARSIVEEERKTDCKKKMMETENCLECYNKIQQMTGYFFMGRIRSLRVGHLMQNINYRNYHK